MLSISPFLVTDDNTFKIVPVAQFVHAATVHHLHRRQLGDVAAAKAAWMRSLRRLSLSCCKPHTYMGLGCVVVGCTDLRELSLKWCLGVTDLGLHLLALKCKKLTSLDLSYTMVSAIAFFISSPFLLVLGSRRRKILSLISSCSNFLGIKAWDLPS